MDLTTYKKSIKGNCIKAPKLLAARVGVAAVATAVHAVVTGETHITTTGSAEIIKVIILHILKVRLLLLI